MLRHLLSAVVIAVICHVLSAAILWFMLAVDYVMAWIGFLPFVGLPFGASNWVPIVLVALTGFSKTRYGRLLALPLFALMWFVPAFLMRAHVAHEIENLESRPKLTPVEMPEEFVLYSDGELTEQMRIDLLSGRVRRIVFMQHEHPPYRNLSRLRETTGGNRNGVVEWTALPAEDCGEQHRNARSIKPPLLFGCLHSRTDPETLPTIVFGDAFNDRLGESDHKALFRGQLVYDPDRLRSAIQVEEVIPYDAYMTVRLPRYLPYIAAAPQRSSVNSPWEQRGMFPVETMNISLEVASLEEELDQMWSTESRDKPNQP